MRLAPRARAGSARLREEREGVVEFIMRTSWIMTETVCERLSIC